ncbi:stage II sporulation protein P [Candidatus Desulforudis audaxviator]|uniref:Stage II sporulation P family protein n=1 Tax=Desulforudis audaxviator (strain MP104C) TaxID=477974 RepID=B1I466_DESAP|nr:stage II sporulation protein P [Candidatus Desulforudis audaxviator]ACA59687.1 Stage II sporulation P family protein [Candidatus Desulforudis audaxviator MP104C]AZK59680.1 Stage II sporulation protein P [Candidatus Desulforudis audaxviator]
MGSKLVVRLVLVCFLVTLAVIGYLGPERGMTVWTKAETISLDFCDHEAGQYTTVVDEQGKVITKTSRQVFIGDEVITAQAEHYRVVRVDNDIAEARLLGLDRNLLAWLDYFSHYGDELTLPAQAPQGGRRGGLDVAVYHSHTMESYVPDSGRAFEDHGDIIEVGRIFAQSLRQQGLSVFHDTTNHNPHDAQAYERSRRTAVQLLERNPAALIDIHRDGVPDPEFFREQIQGQTVSQVRLVVGRQNPKRDANIDFARRLMARANEANPNVVKEIFMARGNYNQDLISTAILIEAGTYTNSKSEAKGGVSLLAAAVPAVLGVDAAGPDQAGGVAGWRVAFGIALAVILAVAAYLVISAGGVPQAREKLHQFLSREFDFRLLGKPLKLKERRDDKNKPEQ